VKEFTEQLRLTKMGLTLDSIPPLAEIRVCFEVLMILKTTSRPCYCQVLNIPMYLFWIGSRERFGLYQDPIGKGRLLGGL